MLLIVLMNVIVFVMLLIVLMNVIVFLYFHDHDDGHYDDRLSSVVWHVPSIKLKAEPNGQDNG